MLVKPPDIEIRNTSPYRDKYVFFIASDNLFSYFKMLSKDGTSFHLKKGRFTEFIDGRLPMDRERKHYSKEKDIDPSIRMSVSKDNLNSSIYLRAQTIS
jgi:hypothetical protein